MAQKYPQDLLSLIAYLKKLPGVGTRTAERFAFEFLGWTEDQLFALGQILHEIKKKSLPAPHAAV